jgi:zinc/manganese transport system substrate-binding protein
MAFRSIRCGLALTVGLVLAGVTACSSSNGSASNGSGSTLEVVASTNVYGDIASQIAGSKARITSIISNPQADPHSYEANVQNRLAMSKAHVVIENGGGYDDFMDSLLRSTPNDARTVINVVALSGKTAPPGGSLNEHVWYDFPTMAKLATKLADTFAAVDRADATTFSANARTFIAKLKVLEQTATAVKARHSGTGVAITEPVPLYLLQACGLVNRTPPAFSAAIEEGTDVSPRVLADMLALFDNHQVSLVAYNEQTTSAVTERVLAAAKTNSIPVVPVTETLPDGKDYLSWMSDNLSAVQTALAR